MDANKVINDLLNEPKTTLDNLYGCCTPRHDFHILKDEEKKAIIRKRLPNWTGPLWECVHCHAIVEAS